MARETDPDTSAWSRRRLLKSAVATAASTLPPCTS